MSAIVGVYREESNLKLRIIHVLEWYILPVCILLIHGCMLYTHAQMCAHAYIQSGTHAMGCERQKTLFHHASPRVRTGGKCHYLLNYLAGHVSCFNTLVQIVTQKRSCALVCPGCTLVCVIFSFFNDVVFQIVIYIPFIGPHSYSALLFYIVGHRREVNFKFWVHAQSKIGREVSYYVIDEYNYIVLFPY